MKIERRQLGMSARHSEGPLWYRVRVSVRVMVRVSDWRTFAMAAPNQPGCQWVRLAAPETLRNIPLCSDVVGD